MSQGLPLYSFAGTAMPSTTCLEAVTTEIYCLSVLEAGIVKSRWQQVWFLRKAVRQTVFGDSPPDWWFANHLLFIYLFPWLCQVLVAACGIQCPNLRDRTCGPCIGKAESQPLDHQGSPYPSQTFLADDVLLVSPHNFLSICIFFSSQVFFL